MDANYNQINTSNDLVNMKAKDYLLSNARRIEQMKKYMFYSKFYNSINYRIMTNIGYDPAMIQLINHLYEDEIQEETFNKIDLQKSTESFIEFNDFELHNL